MYCYRAAVNENLFTYIVVKVLWCHSHLVWLVFEDSIPTCACSHLESFFVTLEYTTCLGNLNLHEPIDFSMHANHL